MGKSFISLRVLVTLALILFVGAGKYPTEKGVLVLDDTNLAEAIKEHENILVAFYSPHSRLSFRIIDEFLPAWPDGIRPDKFKVAFAKVNAHIEKKARKEHDIYRYPTTKLFIKGDPIEYDGPTGINEVAAWLRKKIEGSTQEASTKNEIEQLTQTKGVVILFFGGKDHKDFGVFDAISKHFDDIAFVYTENSDLKNEFKIPSDTQILALKKFDEKKAAFTGELTANNLNIFVAEHRFPIVQDFNDEIGKRLFTQFIPTLVLLTKKDAAGNRLESIVREIAPKIRGKVVVVVADYNTPNVGRKIANYISVSEGNLPAPGSSVRKFIPSADKLTAEGLLEFVESFANGTLKPELPSEPASEKNDGPVKVVVKETFNEIVLDPTKDVFLEIYRSGCYHCQKLAPIWEEIASSLSSIPNLVIAKLNGEANEFEDMDIAGFPTLKFYAANNKDSPIDYEGQRKKLLLLEWLKDKITVEYDPSVFTSAGLVSQEL